MDHHVESMQQGFQNYLKLEQNSIKSTKITLHSSKFKQYSNSITQTKHEMIRAPTKQVERNKKTTENLEIMGKRLSQKSGKILKKASLNSDNLKNIKGASTQQTDTELVKSFKHD